VEVFNPASTWDSNHYLILNNIYKNSVRTSQETRYFSATNTNRLTLFRETIAVYCEYTQTHCRQNAEFHYLKAGGTYSNHWALKGWFLGQFPYSVKIEDIWEKPEMEKDSEYLIKQFRQQTTLRGFGARTYMLSLQ
jgi:hypothetical protein